MARPGKKAAEAFDLDAARVALAEGAALTVQGLDVTLCRIHGQNLQFATDNRRDPIQRSHRQGRFYEEQELALIKAVFPLGGSFVDIGANVGNHSLYVARFLSPAQVIPFEPNPKAYRLLLTNLGLNGVAGLCDLSHIGLGLSDRSEGGYGMEWRDRNLGGAQMQPGEGSLRVERGDDLLQGVRPDLIKIDVEGMEMQVLAGLDRTVAQARPWLFIEVDNANIGAFEAWAAERGYAVETTLRRYAANVNYLLNPGAEPKAEAAE